MSAKLYALPSPGLRDIPAILRNIASEMEAGKYGQVDSAALVVSGDAIEIFGLGTADAVTAHFLFSLGARQIEDGAVG